MRKRNPLIIMIDMKSRTVQFVRRGGRPATEDFKKSGTISVPCGTFSATSDPMSMSLARGVSRASSAEEFSRAPPGAETRGVATLFAPSPVQPAAASWPDYYKKANKNGNVSYILLKVEEPFDRQKSDHNYTF